VCPRIEEEIARELERVLAGANGTAVAVRAEIAAVLAQIDAGGTVLRAAIETGNEEVRRDVVAAVEGLGAGFADMGFILSDLAQAATGIQRSLDEQGASVRAVLEQNVWLSTEIRLVREELRAVERHARAGGQPGLGEQRSLWTRGSPYRGLLPFGEADSEVFYGRERLTSELAVMVDRHHRATGGMILVTGATGAGKSSLVRAGLVPALSRGSQVPGSEHWPRMVITPTRSPLTELATHVAALGGFDPFMVREGFARNPADAHLAIRQALIADHARRGRSWSSDETALRLVLVVDQFEQVFTLSPARDQEAERQAFVTALGAAANNPAGPAGHPTTLVIAVVRGDFCDRCAGYPELASALRDGPFIVGPMHESDFRVAITGPADTARLQVDPALVDTVLADLRATDQEEATGVLPLLSQAMLSTWENRSGSRLTIRGYSQAGGVRSAVQRTADAALESLSPTQRDLARDVLRSLTVTSRDGRLSRRPMTREDLYAASPDAGLTRVDEVLETFAARRLIVLNDGTAQIAHDVLLTAWPRLRGWLDDDRASWVLHSQFSEDAADWRDNSEDASFLYRGTQLAALQQAALQWSANPGRYPALTGTQQDFLTASEKAAARRSRQRRLVMLSLATLLTAALISGGLAIAAARTASHQRDLAISQRESAVSARVATQSEESDITNPATASMLAAAAWRIAPTAEARESLREALAQPGRGILINKGLSAEGTEALAFTSDSAVVVTGSSDQVRFWSVTTRRQLGAPINIGFGLLALALSPDGHILATANGDGNAQLWDVATHHRTGPPISIATSGPTGNLTAGAVAFNPNGKILATGGASGRAQLWDTATHRQVGRSMAAGGQVSAVAFSPNGEVLATAGNDVRLWDVATQRQIGTAIAVPGGFDFASLAFSQDGRTLAFNGSGRVRLVDVATQRLLGTAFGSARSVNAITFRPGTQILVTAGADGVARMWDVTTRQQIGQPMSATAAGSMGAAAISPDGKTLATASGDGTARLWDIEQYDETGNPLVAGSTRRNPAMAFSPDGKTLLTGDGNRLRLWNVTDRRPTGPAIIAPGTIAAVAYSPGGKIVAAAKPDGTVLLWDVTTRREYGRPMAGTGTATAIGNPSLAFGPSGTILAVAEPDGTVRSWNVATQQPIVPPVNIGPFAASTLAFSPAGKLLALQGGGQSRSSSALSCDDAAEWTDRLVCGMPAG